MQKKSSKKPIIIGGTILILLVLAYFYFSGSPVDTSALLGTSDIPTSEAALSGAKILNLLNQISSLHIDIAIFNSNVYRSLVDHTVPVLEQNVGKPNPFSTFPGAGGAPPASSFTPRSP